MHRDEFLARVKAAAMAGRMFRVSARGDPVDQLGAAPAHAIGDSREITFFPQGFVWIHLRAPCSVADGLPDMKSRGGPDRGGLRFMVGIQLIFVACDHTACHEPLISSYESVCQHLNGSPCPWSVANAIVTS